MTDDYREPIIVLDSLPSVIDQQMQQIQNVYVGGQQLFPIQKQMLDHLIDGTWDRKFALEQKLQNAFEAGRRGKLAGLYKDLFDILNSDSDSDTFHFLPAADLENSVSVLALKATDVLFDPPPTTSFTPWFYGDVFQFTTPYSVGFKDDPVHVRSKADFMNVVRKNKSDERVYRSSNGTTFTVYG